MAPIGIYRYRLTLESRFVQKIWRCVSAALVKHKKLAYFFTDVAWLIYYDNNKPIIYRCV